MTIVVVSNLWSGYSMLQTDCWGDSNLGGRGVGGSQDSTGVAKDLVVVLVVEVERVACTWEVVKLLLLTRLATVEDREL